MRTHTHPPLQNSLVMLSRLLHRVVLCPAPVSAQFLALSLPHKALLRRHLPWPHQPPALVPWVCILAAHRLGNTSSHMDFQRSWSICHMWKLGFPAGSQRLQWSGYQMLMLAQKLLCMNELLRAREEVCVNSWNWEASEFRVSWAWIQASQRPQAGAWASAFTRNSDTLLVSS